MQQIYIQRPGHQTRNFRTQFLDLIPEGTLAKLHSVTWSCLLLRLFSCTLLQRLFLWVHLRIVPQELLEILLKIVSLHVKLETKCIKASRQVASGNYDQKWLFCKACVLCNILFYYLLPKFLKKTFKVSHS